ncbi:MAG: TRAP transporter large permease, partial [Terriglobales bacterium]
RLLRVLSAFFGWLPGGIALMVVVACAVFTWGGSAVTILGLGGLLVPMMVEARYPEKFCLGFLNGSGAIGLLFPPSIPVILYGVYAHTPIDRLFVAGLLPGCLMAALVGALGVREGVRRQAARPPFAPREALRSLWDAKWELGLPVVVLVGFFGGLGTLTEAAALTVIYALVAEFFIYRDLSLRRDYVRVARECAVVMGGVLVILAVAMGFSNYLVDAQIPMQIAAWAQASVHSKGLFLLLLNGVLLLVGSTMDIFPAILVLAPLVAPLGASFGVDPLQLGIIFLANLELGFLTPPAGLNLCLAAYRFRQPMFTITRATLPFYAVLLAGVLLITYFPALTLAPVHWFYR